MSFEIPLNNSLTFSSDSSPFTPKNSQDSFVGFSVFSPLGPNFFSQFYKNVLLFLRKLIRDPYFAASLVVKPLLIIQKW